MIHLWYPMFCGLNTLMRDLKIAREIENWYQWRASSNNLSQLHNIKNLFIFFCIRYYIFYYTLAAIFLAQQNFYIQSFFVLNRHTATLNFKFFMSYVSGIFSFVFCKFNKSWWWYQYNLHKMFNVGTAVFQCSLLCKTI